MVLDAPLPPFEWLISSWLDCLTYMLWITCENAKSTLARWANQTATNDHNHLATLLHRGGLSLPEGVTVPVVFQPSKV